MADKRPCHPVFKGSSKVGFSLAGMDARRPPQNMDVLLADKESGIPKGADDCAPFGLGREIRSQCRCLHERGAEQPRRKELPNITYACLKQSTRTCMNTKVLV